MAFGNGYTFGFAAAICIVCSSALATVSLGLKDTQEANARRDLQKNILAALDLPADGSSISGEAVDALWAEKVDVIAVSAKDGSKLSVAEADIDKDNDVDAEDFALARAEAKAKGQAPDVLGLFINKDTRTVAVPMNGAGLWGPISGYVAFDPKITTVKGTTFFAPKETPGLGAEITADAFEDAWLGKKVVDNGQTRPIRVLKDPECDEKNDPYCVDGVSGATITCRGVDAMVASALTQYEPYFKTVR
jgi:Na+-transporting NADH:ubiquinone oxidoreductase subunit C